MIELNLIYIKTQRDQFDQLANRIKGCSKCRLCEEINNYVPGTIGNTAPHILFIGEAPGFDEDIQGKPFVGKSGKILFDALNQIFGYQYENVSIINAVNCRPPKNRTPTKEERDACYPWLKEKIQIIKPHFIITLGKSGIEALLKTNGGSMKEYRQNYYYTNEINGKILSTFILPTYHPMATQYVKARHNEFIEDLKSIEDASFLNKRHKVEVELFKNDDTKLGF